MNAAQLFPHRKVEILRWQSQRMWESVCRMMVLHEIRTRCLPGNMDEGDACSSDSGLAEHLFT